MADPLDRTTGKALAKAGVVQAHKIVEGRSPQVVPGLELGLARGGGELIPGTGREAVIAAIDPVPDCSAKRAVDGTGVFDREIRDAPPGIETVGRRKGRRRAGVQT